MIYPILHWLLEQSKDLKQRAYLARYLVKLDIPGDVLIDSEVSENNQLVKSFFLSKFLPRFVSNTVIMFAYICQTVLKAKL